MGLALGAIAALALLIIISTITILNKLEDIMAELDDLKAAETGREAADAAELTLLQSINAQLVAALAAGNGSVSAADLQPIIDQMNAATAKQNADIAANSPATPAPAAA